MREILFRGKRLDNGEWVASGNLLHADDNGKHSYYIPVYGNRFGTVEDEHDNILSIEYGTFYKVDPATVGQYTGLTDKNGKRIFEGDVVRFTERQLGGKDVPVVEAVEFSEGGFATHRYFLNNWLRNAAKGNCQLQDIEVIDNIHDNPELLEEV